MADVTRGPLTQRQSTVNRRWTSRVGRARRRANLGQESVGANRRRIVFAQNVDGDIPFVAEVALDGLADGAPIR